MAKLYSIILTLFLLSTSASAQNNNISDSLAAHSSQIVKVGKTKYTNPKKIKKVKTYMVNSSRFQRDISTMSEGYNAYQGFYGIKDHIITGKINLISVTFGTTITTYQDGNGTVTHYYLQKQGMENNIHEVFLTNKTIHTFLGISKAALAEAFEDDPNLILKVNQLTKLRKKDVKLLVDEYNMNHK